jgi:hypothetical protein
VDGSAAGWAARGGGFGLRRDSVVVRRPAHGFAKLADPGTAWGYPGAEGARLLELAQEGGAAAQPVELLRCLAGVLGHGGTVLVGSGEAPRGGSRLT